MLGPQDERARVAAHDRELRIADMRSALLTSIPPPFLPSAGTINGRPMRSASDRMSPAFERLDDRLDDIRKRVERLEGGASLPATATLRKLHADPGIGLGVLLHEQMMPAT